MRTRTVQVHNARSLLVAVVDMISVTAVLIKLASDMRGDSRPKLLLPSSVLSEEVDPTPDWVAVCKHGTSKTHACR